MSLLMLVECLITANNLFYLIEHDIGKRHFNKRVEQAN